MKFFSLLAFAIIFGLYPIITQAADNQPPKEAPKKPTPVAAARPMHQPGSLAALAASLGMSYNAPAPSAQRAPAPSKQAVPSVLAGAAAPTNSGPQRRSNWSALPIQARTSIASFCDLPTCMAFRIQSTSYKAATGNIYTHSLRTGAIKLPDIGGRALLVCPFSSLKAAPFAADSGTGGLLPIIKRFLSLATSRITIVSDQFTDLSLVDILADLKRGVEEKSQKAFEIRIICGDNPRKPKNMEEKLKAARIRYDEITYPEIPGSHKRKPRMHNKFILIDHFGVLVGSPNATWNAYTSNIESFMAIYNPTCCAVYSAYADYIQESNHRTLAERKGEVGDASSSLFRAIGTTRQRMNDFNNIPNCPLKLCLAPIGDIRPFVLDSLVDARSININMFLISRATDTRTDVIAMLKGRAARDVKISIKIDGKAYDKKPDGRCMVEALHALDPHAFDAMKNPNINIMKIYVAGGLMHDKLMLMHRSIDLGAIYTVVIGSAGFTDNVQDNYNAENMVTINSPFIYNFFLEHFDLTR